KLESGGVNISCMDLNAPSPLAAEIINAKPYAFLDDGDAENRRTRAISRNPRDLDDAAMLSIINVPAMEQVRAESWISPRNPDELHDGLLQLGFLTRQEFTSGCSSSGALGEAGRWGGWFQALVEEWRACCVRNKDGRQWWVATERLNEFMAVSDAFTAQPDPRESLGADVLGPRPESREQAVLELVRGRLAGLGPVSSECLAKDLDLPHPDLMHTLLALQNEGYVIRMAASAEQALELWCERRLLARIHRYSREQRRHASKAVSPSTYMRFLVAWHGLDGPAADTAQALELLEGWTAPLASWESSLLQSRCKDYSANALDQLILTGQWCWSRPVLDGNARQQIVAASPICFLPRSQVTAWQGSRPPSEAEIPGASRKLLDLLRTEGAMFTDDLQRRAGLLRPQLEHAMGTLVARGLVTADAFSPLRWLIRPEAVRRRQIKARQRHGSLSGVDMLGRWSAVVLHDAPSSYRSQEDLSIICSALLRRYGVVFRAVLERETLLPPWRQLLRYFRRMEDRGEVHGGRFVDGFSGEQFALPEAVGLLKRHTKQGPEGRFTVISGADPLNLGGIITPGVKTAALSGQRILLCDGVPYARSQGEDVELLDRRKLMDAEQARRLLTTVRALRPGQSMSH
ncbi:MAG TPA: hypothetical protein VKN35_15040, partial [Xanthomonadales bacterium]|nr:hypothetical protein [Xanthomonadales bacterium]